MSSDVAFPTTFILAGGLATRLGAVSQKIPKAMMEVAGEPFIAHQLRLLAREGTARAIILTQHLSTQIENFVGDGRAFGLSVEYCQDGERLLGTGGAIKNALSHAGDDFAVIYGDTYLDISFPPIYRHFLSQGKSGLMTVLANNNRWDASNVLFTDGEIRIYDKKHRTADMQHIDYGLSVFKRSAFDSFLDDTAFDLADVFKLLLAREDLSGYEVSQRFYEIGTPESLAETAAYLLSKR